MGVVAHIIHRNDFNYAELVSNFTTNGIWEIDQLRLPEFLVGHIKTLAIGNKNLIDTPI